MRDGAQACGSGSAWRAAGPPVPSAYLARLAAARIPADAAAVVVKPLDGGALRWSANDRQADESGEHHEARHHLFGAALVRARPSRSAPRCCPTRPCIGEVLRGDLYVRGGGDPKLVIEDLWLLVNRLRGFGIREIRGDVVLDKTLFEPLTHDPAEFDGEEGRAYNVGPDALLVNFKSIAITFVPDSVAEGRARDRRAGSRGPQGAAHRARRRRRLRRLARPAAGRHQRPDEHPHRGVYPLACGERAIYLGRARTH